MLKALVISKVSNYLAVVIDCVDVGALYAENIIKRDEGFVQLCEAIAVVRAQGHNRRIASSETGRARDGEVPGGSVLGSDNVDCDFTRGFRIYRKIYRKGARAVVVRNKSGVNVNV